MLRMFMAVAILAALAASPGNAEESAIKIGISQPISGPTGEFFQHHMVNPVILAIDQQNAAGGLLGHKIEYIVEDNKVDASTGAAIARKFVDIDKVSMISISTTPPTLATIPIAEEHHVIVMTVSQNPRVTQSPWAFRATFTGPEEGRIQADFVFKKLHARTAALFAEDNDAIRQQFDAFRKEFTALGGKIVDSESFKGGDQDFSAQLTKLRSANADVLNISTLSARGTGLTLKQAAQLGYHPKHVITAEQGIDPEVRQIAGNLVKGIYYTGLSVDQAWNDKVFKPRFGYDANSDAGGSYDGTRIYFEAVKRAGSLDPVKVRDALRQIHDFHGVLGTWGYHGSGEPNLLPAVHEITE